MSAAMVADGQVAGIAAAASALLDRASYLRVAATVAGSGIPIQRLVRPRGRWSADQLADIVEGRTQS